MIFSPEEQAIAKKAYEHAKKIKNGFSEEYTNKATYKPEDRPVSVFMSGSPGAGKTELSKQLLSRYETREDRKILRIDPDEFRNEFKECGYDGKNSFLFQRAVSLLVEKIHDLALKNRQSFILDGTLSKYEVAYKNIKRSLKKERFVQILYVYQEPMQAWQFVQAREAIEGRNITPEHFVSQYFDARRVVNSLKDEFGKHINIDLLVKNVDGSNGLYKAGVDVIDNHIPEKYTCDQVLAITSHN